MSDSAGVQDARELRERVQQAGLVHRLEFDLAHLTDEWYRIVGIIQRFQPAGPPPPGDAGTLVWWIMRSLSERAERAESDLAAARAALEPFAALPSLDGPYINVQQRFYVRTGDIRNARGVLSRLGTGEALAAVREGEEGEKHG